MKKTTFIVSHMDCSAEEQMVRMKLEDFPEIKKLQFDLPARKLEVFHLGPPEPIAKSLAELNLGSKFSQSEDVNPDQYKVEPANYTAEGRILRTVLLINFGAFLMEVIAGFASKSMGLVADSLDMLADAFIYALSLYAVGKATSSKKRIAGLSGYLQVGLAVSGLTEVIRRFIGQEDLPDFLTMVIISIIALIANSLSLYLIQKAKSTEAHMQASYIFTSNDVIVNLGVIVAGVLVFFTNSKVPDLVVGALVFAIVIRGAISILKLSK